MPREPRRVVDPGSKFVESRLRVKSQRDLELAGQRGQKTQDDPTRRQTVILCDVLSFYREDIGASGDADYTMRQAMPSTTTAWGETTLDAYMGAAGKIVGMRLWSSTARTAGTATGQVQVTENGVVSNYLMADCVLDAVNTQTIGQMLSFANAIAFAKGATIRAEVQTVGWTPTTADAAAEIIVAFVGL